MNDLLLLAGILLHCCVSVCFPGGVVAHIHGKGLEQQGCQVHNQGSSYWLRNIATAHQHQLININNNYHQSNYN